MEFLYKFACFDCQIAFKKPATLDSDLKTAWLADSELAHKCPKCDHKMAFMGRNFRTPKKSERSKWLAAKLLWEAGFRYCGNGYHEDPALPEDRVYASQFLKQHKKHTQKIAEKQVWESYN